MSALDEKTKQDAFVDNASVNSTLDDDRVLQEIGYVPSFKREFSNLATVRPPLPFTRPRFAQQVPNVDQLRVQHHGPLLEHRDDVQHAAAARRARVRHLVLDPRRVHVLHARCVPSPACARGPG